MERCRRCGGTGLEAPGGYGLQWGDLLIDRATGELVQVRYIAARRMVVWSLCAAGRTGALRISDAPRWRARYLLHARLWRW